MDRNEILNQVKREIEPQVLEGYFDQILINRVVDATLKAINYSQCCKSDSEQLKDLEILSFEEWQEQNQELIRKSIGITGNEIAVELDLYSKYKTDQLLNL
jgi:hypothetical protein